MSEMKKVGSSAYERQLAELAEQAENYYTNLPYHNFAHAEHTQQVGRQLAELCLENDLEVSPFVVEVASLFHDADYHLPLPRSIRSKELRSSRAAGSLLRSYSIPSDTIHHIQAAIRSTEVGKPCLSPEAVIVRRADLDNITGDYFNFLLNTWRLYREEDLLKKPEDRPSIAEFLCNSVKVLRSYTEEDMQLGEFDDRGFSFRARMNIENLAKETPINFIRRIAMRQVAS